jgi:hypothetical protein
VLTDTSKPAARPAKRVTKRRKVSA